VSVVDAPRALRYCSQSKHLCGSLDEDPLPRDLCAVHGADSLRGMSRPPMPGRGGAASSAGDDAVEWSGAEQEQLEALMGQYPEGGHLAGPQRYIALAAQLPRKTARDVALRVRWTLQRDSLKKRDTGGKKVKHKSEREPRAQSIFSVGVWPTSAASQPASEPAGMSAAAAPLMGAVPAGGGAVQINTVQYAASIPQLEDHGADTIGNLGGQTAELLDQNLAIISQVRATSRVLGWTRLEILGNGEEGRQGGQGEQVQEKVFMQKCPHYSLRSCGGLRAVD
jgi:hypothetical protein